MICDECFGTGCNLCQGEDLQYRRVQSFLDYLVGIKDLRLKMKRATLGKEDNSEDL